MDMARRGGLLSRAFIPNIFEWMGNLQTYTGFRRSAEAWGEGGQLFLTNRKKFWDLYNEYVEKGAITREFFLWNPDRPMRTGVPKGVEYGIHTLRSAGKLAALLTKGANEYNDFTAAHAAEKMVTDLKAGKTTKLDRARLEAMDFKPEEVDLLMSGEAPRELSDKVVRQMAAFTQGSGAVKGERGWALSRRRFTDLFPFQTYASVTVGRAGDLLTRASRSLESYAKEKNASNRDAMYRDVSLLGQFLAGKGVSGAASMTTRAFFIFGLAGLTNMLLQAQDDPIGTSWEWSKYALFGGVAGDFFESMAGVGEENREVWDQMMRAISPAAMTEELLDSITGVGPYRDQPEGERMLRFATRQFPLASSMVGWFGDVALNAALSQHYAFRRKHAKLGGGAAAEDPSGRREAFRMAMRSAVDTMRKGGDVKDILPPLYEAAGVKGRRAVAQSLLGRRIFSGSNWSVIRDNPELLRRYLGFMGEENLQVLQGYDRQLEWLARLID
jgi:hypothetical protein